MACKKVEVTYTVVHKQTINWPGGRADCMELYGTPLLCEVDDE